MRRSCAPWVAVAASFALCCVFGPRCGLSAESSHQEWRGSEHAAGQHTRPAAPPSADGLGTVRLTVLYDNNPYDGRLETAWGFSCLIEGPEKTVLFDTGGDGAILLSNMKTLGIDPKRVDVVVISHIHRDHCGGLEALLARNNAVVVYLPESFPSAMKDVVRRAGAKLVEVSGSVRICENVYSTGELGRGLREQSLAIRTGKGLVVVTGCAHPGVVNVVRKARELCRDNVYLVLGGFHLCGLGASEIGSVVRGVRAEGVAMVAPCHCSGDTARREFARVYGERFVPLGAGFRGEVSSLPKGTCVYAGTGAVRARDVEAALSSLGIPYKELDERAIVGGALKSCSVLIVPGGYTQRMLEALGSGGAERIRAFVSAGGGYIGICAGAYLAAGTVEVPERPAGLGVIPIKNRRMAGKGMTKITIARREHPLAQGCPRTMEIWYENGPIIEPADGVEVIATYEGGAAVVSGTYGRGMVVVFSPHPEGCIEAGVPSQKTGTLKLLSNAIAFATPQQL